MDGEPIKKKRGRKKKTEIDAENQGANITISIEDLSSESQNSLVEASVEPATAKKRGRKPKGGKLILKQPEKTNSDAPLANIILHLRCSMQDLNEYDHSTNKIVTDPLVYNPVVPPTIMTYNSNLDRPFSNYDSQINVDDSDAYHEFDKSKSAPSNSICQACSTKLSGKETLIAESQVKTLDEDDDVNIKDVNQKLKKIKLQLYKNTNPDKKSACFWCTYDYDNPSCYIPKYEMDGQLYGYGSFCRPECAVAYLMKENLDDSTKFERYHLLNQMYSKIYDYKKNIKPAPNPYFLLDKFYGNLTIQEYRKLLKTEHMLLVIEKPMTRILPELHEDNEDFIMNIYGTKAGAKTGDGKGQSSGQGVYKVKRQSEKQKGPSKTTIMKESFGLV
jgi:hypothetical protein